MSRSGTSKWTDAELSIVKAHPELDGKELAALLPGRTHDGVLQKRIALGLDYKGKKWSKEQDAYLMEHRHESAEDVGKALNRPTASVMVRRHEIGGRRLTLCHKCGVEMPKRNQFESCSDCAKTVAEMNAQPTSRFNQYKHSAKRRGYTFGVNFTQFLGFYGKPCTYCGDEFDGVGLDRIDNAIGYEIENIASCCEWCNRMKLEFSASEWLSKLNKIVKNHSGVTA